MKTRVKSRLDSFTPLAQTTELNNLMASRFITLDGFGTNVPLYVIEVVSPGVKNLEKRLRRFWAEGL